MAPTFACVFALLVSQVTVVSAASSPFTDPANANTLACAAYDAGCTCAGVGLVDNTSVPVTENCSGSAATFNKCSSKCCGDPAVATCGSVLTNDVIVGGLCGTTMEADYAKLLNAAGATTVLQKANCCKAKVTATCAAVTCNVVVTDNTDHGATAVIYQAKAGVNASLACTSNKDCEAKCCEKNPMTCEGNSAMANSNTMCGVNYTDKPRWAAGVYPTCSTQTMTTAYAATFTDNATFKAACCDVVPPVIAVVKGKCAATHVCPTHYQAKSPMPTTDCMGATCMTDDCCDKKAGVTTCSDNCTSMTSNAFGTMIPNSCGSTTTMYCNSVRCASGLVLDRDPMKMIAGAANATDAAFSTACCIAGPPVTPTPVVVPPAKCAAYFAAAAAGVAKAAGSVGAAYMQGASLPILAVAVLMTIIKLGV